MKRANNQGPTDAFFGSISRGLGDVAALGDVLAVLLVSHTDPLLGDHLRGATTCPGHPSASLARLP